MNASLLAWLEREQGALVDDVASRLLGRSAAVFHACGEPATRQIVARLLAALHGDIVEAGDGNVREALNGMSEALAPRGLGFYDIRLLSTSLRLVLLESLAKAPEVEPPAFRTVEDWLFQLPLLGAMYLVAQREQAFQEQTALLEVRQLEGQLAELQKAYDEKTRLLEMIREASTPIAPVHEGILVVPLVGVFDALRAQALTEKLLDTVVQRQARVVILDISGVPVFDAVTAQHILDAERAVRLLGAELILVGLSPEIARTVSALGVDLSGLSTRSSLQVGLADALARLRLRIVGANPR
jgi:anti-anti-sigma factor